MKKVLWHGHNLYVSIDRYRNGQTVIELCDDDSWYGQRYATASIALTEMHPEGCAWIKDYSENEGMVDALVDGGVIAPEPVMTVHTGYVQVSAYRLL
jgi:hypothetical protein